MARHPLWKPGESPYADWLKTLTPAERESHLEARRNKKSMRKAFETIVLAQQEEWLKKINQGMVAVINRAIETGDASALIAVHDRIIGKPVETINADTNQILPWEDEKPTNATE
jgi:hypothetical protein